MLMFYLVQVWLWRGLVIVLIHQSQSGLVWCWCSVTFLCSTEHQGLPVNARPAPGYQGLLFFLWEAGLKSRFVWLETYLVLPLPVPRNREEGWQMRNFIYKFISSTPSPRKYNTSCGTHGSHRGKRESLGFCSPSTCHLGEENFKLNIEILMENVRARMYLCVCVLCNLHTEDYLAVHSS